MSRVLTGVMVEAKMDKYGNITVIPSTKAFFERVKKSSDTPGIETEGAYIQNTGEVRNFIDEVPKAKRNWFENGWPVRFYLGEDYACCLFNMAY